MNLSVISSYPNELEFSEIAIQNEPVRLKNYKDTSCRIDDGMKCGEIVMASPGSFTFVCTLCKELFYELHSFGAHVLSFHMTTKYECETKLHNCWFQTNMFPEGSIERMGALVETQGVDIQSDSTTERVIVVSDGISAGRNHHTSSDAHNEHTSISFGESKLSHQFNGAQTHYEDLEKVEEIDPLRAELADTGLHGALPKCPPCNKQQTKTSNRARSKNTATLRCNFCPKLYKSNVSYNLHLGRAHRAEAFKESPNRCKLCNEGFASYYSAWCHMRWKLCLKSDQLLDNGRNVVATCKLCGQIFTNHKAFRLHLFRSHSAVIIRKTASHASEKPTPPCCDKCGQQCSDVVSLDVHIEAKHQGCKRFKCRLCSTTFFMKHRNEKHLCSTKIEILTCFLPQKSSMDPRVEFIACQYCLDELPDLQAAKYHMEKHTGVESYSCIFCSKNYLARYDRDGHVRYHNGERPFQCTHCSKQFLYNGKLRKHMKSRHADEDGRRNQEKDLIIAYTASVDSDKLETETADTVDDNHLETDPYSNEDTQLNLDSTVPLLVGGHFVCLYGCRLFSQKRNFLRHMQSVHQMEVPKSWLAKGSCFDTTKPKEIKCAQCNEQCSDFFTLKSHLQEHSDKKFASNEVIDRKEHSHTYMACPYCSLMFRHKRRFLPHLEKKHGHVLDEDAHQDPMTISVPEGMSCKYCLKKFENLQIFTAHVKTHSGLMAFSCPVCSRHFDCREARNGHLNIHSSTFPYKCDRCPKAFASKSNLDRHRDVHETIRTYKCDYCDKTFSQSTSKRSHMDAIHTKIRAYQCEECGKTFVKSTDLNKHRLKHKNLKNYKCDVCNKAFSSNQYLKNHRVVHTGERAYVCKVCGKDFARINTLRNHTLLHSDVKRYECKVCGKTFAQHAGLYSHMQVAHGTKVPINVNG